MNTKTLTVRYVPKEFIQGAWPSVEGMLSNALRHSAGEYNMDQLKSMLVMGVQHLLVADDGEQVRGAATIAFENYPNDRIAFVTAIGGRMIANMEIWKQFEDWCKSNGCTKVRGFAFDSVARLWKKKFNVDTVYVVVEKKL
jgi:hypothetical protein